MSRSQAAAPVAARPGTAAAATALTSWERWGLIGLGVATVLFGILFELRSALLTSRKGDLDVFLRAAWAARTGEDIYEATDDNDHHYHYPPFLAIVLTPLADPPAGCTPLPGTIPYSVSVALWYLFSIGCLAVAVNGLAGALESMLEPALRPRPGSRGWWALRIHPCLACLPALCGALMRGQVDMILLLLVCGMIAALLRRRSATAGVFLACAISIKVIPAFLLIYPLWKRDLRCLLGCAAGLVFFLGIVPMAFFGPARTVAYYKEWHEVLVRPALSDKGDQTRAEELTQVTSTDSQSFLAMIHNTRFLDRATRPAAATPGERQAHWALGLLLTLGTLAAGRRLRNDAAATVVFLGALTVLMVLSSPVCHLHYFSMSLPLAIGLVAFRCKDERASLIGSGGLACRCASLPQAGNLTMLFVINAVANVLPRLPGFEAARDTGLASYATLLLWAAGCITLWRAAARRRQVAPSRSTPSPVSRPLIPVP